MTKSLPALFLLAAIALGGALLSGAEDPALQKAFDRLPEAEKHYRAGLKEFRAGRYGEAVAAFEECAAVMPRHAYAHYYLANIAYIQGEFESALASMDRSLADLPFMQDLNDFALKRKSRSIASYQQMLDEGWENAVNCRAQREIESLTDELSAEKGKLELQAEKEQAVRALQGAHYRYFLGNIHFQLKRPADAARLYGEAIALDPRHAGAYNNAAAIRYMAGDHAGALDLLTKAEGVGIGDNVNLKLKHLVFEALGRPTEGILAEDLSAGPEADMGVVRFAVAYKFPHPLLPPLYENCYVVFSRASKQAAIIDPGVEDPRIADFVEKNGLKVGAILNTHDHPDHTAANGRYAALYKAVIVAPRKDAANLPAAPGRAVEDGETVRIDGFLVKVLHTPGHTPGSSCFLIGNYLFSGDTLFKNDICKLPDEAPGKAVEAQRRFVRMLKDKLMVLDDATRVCPGHGPVSTIAEEKRGNPFLSK
jgi:glyoxylase-like metal-dependent hydrolase (beta-lactamase superfamily II)